MPASLALIREAFPDPAERARAISVWAMGGSVGAAAGPVLGGVLSELNWRMIFFVNLPVGLLALFLLARTARSPRKSDAPFDWTGQIAAVAAMGGLTYAAIEAGAVGIGAPRVLLALAVAVTAAMVFLTSQARGRNPMVPLELLRARTMALSATIGFALNVGFYGMIFLLGQYLQQEQDLSPMATGLAFLPMTLLTAVSSPTAARLSAKFGARMPIITGQLLMAVGLVALCVPPASAPAWLLVLLMIPVGTGGGLAVPAVTSLLLDRVPAQRAGTASGVLNASRQLGGALSVAVLGAMVSPPRAVPARAAHQPPDRRIARGPDRGGLRTPQGEDLMTSTSATSAWTGQELDSIEHAEELEIASLRRDGELGSRRTIWVVRVGDGIYVRSVNGPGSDWYRCTRARQEGRVQACGVGKDVTIVDAADDTTVNDAVDAAYRAKYGHYAAYIIKAITSPEASSTTMRLEPR
ncbi:MFS transporter [Streptomyces europaeiscabiei]|uniref:MFS transporter n=1 Tax=Streptomyces europaeiscabiei TaxID=146819 RepID=UPI0029BA910E|nr:MFS transporter [Streptomyces europaeiscabiei]MDX3635653.1 MFS transporter [Streptomyces europaeiscabiei]MDX3653884.1 MFS transporter [Streptomyces europaeiscabiei]